MSNLERLVQAGVVDVTEISFDQGQLINDQMSEDEVRSLIASKAKLGGPMVVPKADGGAL